MRRRSGLPRRTLTGDNSEKCRKGRAGCRPFGYSLHQALLCTAANGRPSARGRRPGKRCAAGRTAGGRSGVQGASRHSPVAFPRVGVGTWLLLTPGAGRNRGLGSWGLRPSPGRGRAPPGPPTPSPSESAPRVPPVPVCGRCQPRLSHREQGRPRKYFILTSVLVCFIGEKSH